MISTYIARRVSTSQNSSFSKLIIRIAIVAVALSVSVMIIATSLIAGFKKEITSKLFGFQGHIHIQDFQSNESFEAVPIDTRTGIKESLDSLKNASYSDKIVVFGYELPWDFKKQMRGGISHLQTFAEKPCIFTTKEEIEGIILKGVGSDFDWTFLEKHLVEGNIIDLKDSITSDMLISQQTAKRLKLGVGDKFLLYFVKDNDPISRRFEVRGIYNTGLAEKDERYAIVDIRQIQRFNNWQPYEVSGYEVFVDNLKDLDPLNARIYEQLPMNLFSQTIREKDASIFDWLELQNVNERVILLLMAVVCIINMITALLILILERTNMIGILKALGETNWNIQKIFLWQGAYIVAKGLLWGNVAGLLLCLIQKYGKVIKLPEKDYYVSEAPIEFSFWSIIFINLAILSLVSLVLIIPSLLVRRISPIKAVHFK